MSPTPISLPPLPAVNDPNYWDAFGQHAAAFGLGLIEVVGSQAAMTFVQAFVNAWASKLAQK